MKLDYAFSKGERGKVFRSNAELRMSIYLSFEVQNYLAQPVAEKGIPLGDMVNTLLQQEIQMIESVK